MTKSGINDQLHQNHSRFMNYMSTLPDTEFDFKRENEKWSAGQQLDHIRRSVQPLRFLLALPKWLLRLLLKKSTRPSRTYGELVARYHKKLEGGGRASGRFVPSPVTASQKEMLLKKLRTEVSGLTASLEKFSEDELDLLVIPHPLLGRVTIREMMYFTIYHVEHHQRLAILHLDHHTRAPSL